MPTYEYSDAARAALPHIPKPAFDTIDVKCKKPFFSVNGAKPDQVVCSEKAGKRTWSTVDACVQLACPNPRSKDATIAAMSPTLNLKHTCAHLDQIKIAGAATFKTTAGAAAKFGDNTKALSYGSLRTALSGND